MKKIVSLGLAMSIAFSLAVPAYAAEAEMDKRLEAVTLKAKQTLKIGDYFDTFNGDLTESTPTSQWDLRWSKEGESLQVRITEAGKVLQYHYYKDQNDSPTCNGSLAKFPAITTDQAKNIANTFLTKVMDSKVESVKLTTGDNALSRYGNTNYYFHSKLYVFGVQTPINVSLNVDTEAQAVTSFSRGDAGEDYSTLANPNKAIPLADAAKTLLPSATMHLTYALRENSDSATAYPQFTPASDKIMAVDALTGKLIEVTPTYSPYPLRDAANEKSASAESGGGLTETELKTAAELKDVLSKDTLESKARSISQLGIGSSYQLNSVNYYAYQNESATPKTIANLYFVAESATGKNNSLDKQYILPQPTDSYITVTLDAKTGTLISVSAYRNYGDEKPLKKYSRSSAQTIAQNFASTFEPEKIKNTLLADNNETDTYVHSFVFNQKANNIPFPQNSISISVDAVTGNIVDYAVFWDENIKFSDASKLISAEKACALYTQSVGVIMAYVSEDTSTAQKLRLVYLYNPDSNAWGVDASSGKVLTYDRSNEASLTYSDIAGHYAAAAVKKLAEFKIGFTGGSFAPEKQLTQKDMLTLLVAAGGNLYTTDNLEEDNLYQAAYYMGILTKAERNPAKLVTRAELVKGIVNAAGYSELAKLTDIYSLSFKDAPSIPKNLYGYVAIGKGLGLIKGDVGGKFLPNSTATRAEAAMMLYNYMSR